LKIRPSGQTDCGFDLSAARGVSGTRSSKQARHSAAPLPSVNAVRNRMIDWKDI
jgi:hypothetical protein